MADDKRIKSRRADVVKLRALQKEGTDRRSALENDSLEDAQQSVITQIDLVLAKQTVEDRDIKLLADLEDALEGRIKEEREVQDLERQFQTLRQRFVAEPFRK